jgi:hypothetical protein
MGIAVIIAFLSGSIANATIVFAGGGVATLIIWALIDRLVPEIPLRNWRYKAVALEHPSSYCDTSTQ